MPINWFPGHMHKARKEIAKAMPRVDFILEVLDARLPYSSENPLVEELREDKPCLKVLNKSDLADPATTDAWLEHLNAQEGVTALAHHKGQPATAKALVELGHKRLPKNRASSKPVTAMILGIPNVGKSTMINTLAGRSIAATRNIPAVTKAQNRIRIAHDFTLVDTPGFLWPKLTPQACGYRLAISGAIKDAILEFEDIAFFAARYLLEAYPKAIMDRYDLDELPEDDAALLDAIAARRGCIGRGGTVNLHKACELFIREIRQGALGRISLERPEHIMLDKD